MSESMSEADQVDAQPAPNADSSAAPTTAGGLLRQARQARGLHIAALAASIKVSPQKLEALENDRPDELPGATFTRALAQTVCRALKIEAAPVLALLPHATDKGLDRMSRTLNEPFRDRPGRRVPKDFSALKNPAVIGALLLVVAALAVYLLPSGWWSVGQLFGSTTAAADAAPPVAENAEAVMPPSGETAVAVSGIASGSEPALTASPMIETVHSAPDEVAAASEPAAQASVVNGALQLSTSGESWVEVTDTRGNVLLSRLLQAGETVGLDGASPLRLKVGNAAVTAVTYRGRAVDLGSRRENNVVNLELK